MTRPPRARLTAPTPLLFLGLSPSESRLSRARVAIIPAPFDQTTSYMPGARFGPRAILEASRQVEFYDEELDTECHSIGITTLSEIEIDPANLGAGLERLEAITAKVVEAGMVPFALGGEHTLTLAPGSMSATDVDALRAVGFDDLDILDANNQCAHLNYTNRVANGLGLLSEAVVEERTLDRIPG